MAIVFFVGVVCGFTLAEIVVLAFLLWIEHDTGKK